MAVFWISFTLEDNSTYDDRYTALIDGLHGIGNEWWEETAAFLLLDTDSEIDGVCHVIESAIDTSTDIALVKKEGVKAARIIGAFKDKSIFALLPYVKKR